MEQQYAGCLNVCDDWRFFICYVNQIDSFVQPVDITVVKLSPMAVLLFGVVIHVPL